MNRFIAILLLVISAGANGLLAHENGKLPKKPIALNVPAEYKDYPAVILARSINTASRYIKTYQAVLFNSAESIKDFNVVKIKANAKLHRFKGRIIKADGRVIVLKKKHVYEEQSRTLVFRGLQEGDVLEYAYTEDFIYPIFLRNQIAFDEKYPILKFQFFGIKPKVKEDTWNFNEEYFTSPDKRTIINTRPIPPHVYEPFARNSANLIQIVVIGYAFDGLTSAFSRDEEKKYKNLWQQQINIYSVPPRLGNPLLDSINRDGGFAFKANFFPSSSIKKLIDQKGLQNELEILLEINRYVRDNFVFIQDYYGDLKLDVDGKIGIGYKDYISGIFGLLSGFNFEAKLLITSDRFRYSPFEISSRPPYRYTDHIIYFPKLDLYWEVSNPYYIVGMVSGQLFEVPVITVENGQVVEKRIPFPENLIAASTRTFDIEFSETDEERVNVKFERQEFGILRNSLISYKYQVEKSGTQEQRERFSENLVASDIDFQTDDMNWENYSLTNLNFNEPTIYKASGHVRSALVEDIGKRGIEFSIGRFLGKQVDLRQINVRFSDIDLGYPFDKTWVIRVNLQGREVVNIEELQSSFELEIEGSVFGMVQSNAVVEDGKLIWTVEEKYFQYMLDKKHYPEFRKLVNQLADLTEVRVVLR
jgi:hypothetical protein